MADSSPPSQDGHSSQNDEHPPEEATEPIPEPESVEAPEEPEAPEVAEEPEVAEPVEAPTAVQDVQGPPTRRQVVVLPPPDKRSIALPSGAAMARWTGRTDHSAPREPEKDRELHDTLPDAPPAAFEGGLRPSAPFAADMPGQKADADDMTGSTSARRGWMVPFLGGAIAVVLLAVLGFGVLLIYRATTADPETSVQPSSSPLASSQFPTPSAKSPSQARWSQSATGANAEQVLVPSVIGFTESDATALMTSSGLRVSVRSQASTTAVPGTVVSTDPSAGTPVARDAIVVLYVAQQSPTSSNSAGSRSPSVQPSSPRPSKGERQ